MKYLSIFTIVLALISGAKAGAGGDPETQLTTTGTVVNFRPETNWQGDNHATST